MAKFDSDSYFEYPPREALPPYDRQDTNFKSDYYCGSKKILNLNMDNFEMFTENKEKALVLFYDSDSCHAHGPENELAQLANKTTNHKYGFGAVDCSTDGTLCTKERACQTPIFKLYSNGYEVSSIRDPTGFTTDQLSTLMEMTPVLRESRGNIGGTRAIHPEPPSPEMPPKSRWGVCW